MHVEIIHEVKSEIPGREPGTQLCLQWCKYIFDGELGLGDEYGYRFIWRREGKLVPTRGQAIIRGAVQMQELIDKARDAGWYEKCERVDAG